MRTVDLNADLGEGFGPWSMGDDAALMDIVSSANIACGGHASDPDTMFRTLELAKSKGVSVGAHPGFPDLLGFGRRRLPMSPAEIERFVAAQTGALISVGGLAGVPVNYLKAHGALGNWAAEDASIAAALVRACKAVGNLPILAISGTKIETVARDAGLTVFSEIFADRGLRADGTLVPRNEPQAMITDAAAAAARLVDYARTGNLTAVTGETLPLAAQSICVHGDSPHAVAMARTVKEALTGAGITIRPFVQ